MRKTKKTGKEAARQRKMYLMILIIVIILTAVLIGGDYLWKQTKETSEMTATDHGQESQTQSYKLPFIFCC